LVEEKINSNVEKKSSITLTSPSKHDRNYEKILNDKSVTA
jgi:hypothetical protein